MKSASFESDLDALKALLNGHQLDQAKEFCLQCLQKWPNRIQLLQVAARLCQMRGEFDAMVEHAGKAVALAPQSMPLQMQLLEFLSYQGEFQAIRSHLCELEKRRDLTGADWAQMGQSYTHGGDYEDSLRCFRRAVELSPDSNSVRLGLSTALIALGKMDEAEQQLNLVLQRDPHEHVAYHNRSSLRRWQADDHHIDELLASLHKPLKHPAAEVQICYALGKEYEDLQQWEEAFAYYHRGATARRRLMRYQVENDERILQQIAQVHDEEFVHRGGFDSAHSGPIFVMGLPRSGTTLVDRVLDSHSQVTSVGEINDFALALMREAKVGSDKQKLLSASRHIDLQSVGDAYRNSLHQRRPKADILVDKTPLNYLYIGLIHRALPAARIVYMQRDPMDVAFAMYKTLFLQGYPFSYSFEDLARYQIAQHRLMQHWQRLLPDRILTLQYESLVQEPQHQIRRLLHYCGLNYESQCETFHSNPTASATASAAQVRQPIYRSSVQRWKQYERQLQPLANMLQDAGLLP